MFLRRSTRTHKGKTSTNYQLVESVRTPNGPRQRTICSLGDLGPGSRETWIKRARKLTHAVVGQQDLLDRRSNPEFDAVVEKAKAQRQRHASHPSAEETIAVNPSRITTERHREAGPMHVGHQFWLRLGLDEILYRLRLIDSDRLRIPKPIRSS